MQRDWRLLLEALLIVPAIRIALWLLPFRVVLAVAQRRPAAPDVPMDRVLRAVHAIARRVPGATCLTRALAAMLLLARHGYPSTLRLGVAKENDRVAAHAWLESDGVTIYGAMESPLSPLRGERVG
ncbi:MAG: lasso peptide biosynthesis B2 protein [Thermoanaerobaculia bacterium]